MRIFLVLLVYLAVLLYVVLAKGYSTDKRLQNPSGFNTMMRYGRSSNRNVDNKRPVVYPRADRADNFFLGPRYGKRSTTWSPSESLVYPVQGGPICGQYEDLACSWTGLSNLYKCTLRKDLVVSSN